MYIYSIELEITLDQATYKVLGQKPCLVFPWKSVI